MASAGRLAGRAPYGRARLGRAARANHEPHPASDHWSPPDLCGEIWQLGRRSAQRAGHTWEAAYAAREEKLKRSIEPGKLADLAVWGEYPYTYPAAQLLQVPITMTIVGGKVVYEA